MPESLATAVERGDVDELVRLVDALCATRDGTGSWSSATAVSRPWRAGASCGPSPPTPSTASPSRRRDAMRRRSWSRARAASRPARCPRWRRRHTSGPSSRRTPRPDPPAVLAAHERVRPGRGPHGSRRSPVRRCSTCPSASPAGSPSTSSRTTAPDGVDLPGPQLAHACPGRGRRRGRRTASHDPATDALLDAVRAWTEGSEGRAEAIAVRGDALGAITALGRDRVRMAELAPSAALCTLAWAGASGGAHARRPGAAAGRFAAWWAGAALTGLLDEWPVDAEDARRRADALALVRVGQRRHRHRLAAAPRDRRPVERPRAGPSPPSISRSWSIWHDTRVRPLDLRVDALRFFGLARTEDPCIWQMPVVPALCSGRGTLFGGCRPRRRHRGARAHDRPAAGVGDGPVPLVRPSAVGRGHRHHRDRAGPPHRPRRGRSPGSTARRSSPSTPRSAHRDVRRVGVSGRCAPRCRRPTTARPRAAADRHQGTIMDRLEMRLADGRSIDDLPGPPGDGRGVALGPPPVARDVGGRARDRRRLRALRGRAGARRARRRQQPRQHAAGRDATSDRMDPRRRPRPRGRGRLRPRPRAPLGRGRHPARRPQASRRSCASTATGTSDAAAASAGAATPRGRAA